MTGVLAAWRAAERELNDIATSQDWTRILVDIAALRARYHELFHERLARRDAVVTVGSHGDALAWLCPGTLRGH